MTLLADTRIRFRARVFGRLKTNRVISELVALALIAKSRFPGLPLPSRLAAALVAARRTSLPPLRISLRRFLQPYLEAPRAELWRQNQIGLARMYDGFGGLAKRQLTTSLLLKAPGPNGEKGVLYSSFEYNWMRLVLHHDARAFFSEYLLVGASSGSPPDYAAFANLAGLSPDPIFVGVSNPADMAAYQLMSPVIRAVPLMASDWINPDHYAPKPRAHREIDILMVANWLRLKRHWLLFEALRTMRRDLRVVLVGRNATGRTEKDLRAEAKAFGVRQELEIHTNIPYEEVTRHECDARISLLFSYREGSCVAPAECLFADTPVGMMRDAHVGSKAYINSRTGLLFDRHRLGHALSRFLEESDRFTPRAWALENISCHHSSRRLNELLRDHARSVGQPWTRDLAPLCWRYVPAYVDPADESRMAPAVEELCRRHGVELVKFIYTPPPVSSTQPSG